MIKVRQNGVVYEVSFPYDPNIVALVKNVPGRRWVQQAKFWTIPSDKLGFLLNQLKGTVYENSITIQSDENINENASIDATIQVPDVDISNIKFYVKPGSTPYKHQLDTLRYYIDRHERNLHSGFILGDEPGLGKTLSVINTAIYAKNRYKYKHCLIICCINSSKHNWYSDIVLHTDGEYTPYILGTRYKKDKQTRRYDTGGAEKLADLESGYMYNDKSQGKLPYFLIINIEALRYKVGRKYPITEKLISMINAGHLNMIAVDEIHKNASPTSSQGSQLLKIKKNTASRAEWIPMTGTPIVSKPTDVFLPLKLVDGHTYSSYYAWCKEFCLYGGFGGHEIMGYKNIPILKNMLQNNMLRRLRKDVLDLPPILRCVKYVENSKYQQRLYEQVQSDIRKDRNNILMSLNPMAKLLRLRQVNGAPEIIDRSIKLDDNYLNINSKIRAVIEEIEEAVSCNEKIIVYSNWVEHLRTLYRFISKQYKVCCYTGTMSDADREKHKQVFINNPEYHVMIGTIGALGTSHTLAVARRVCFLDEPWNPSDKEQAEDRVYRIGTTNSVRVCTIITKDTVDEHVHDILNTKSGVSNYIVDNKLDLRNNPELFDLLLS